MQPSYNAPEAPTHLRAGDLPPGLLDHLIPARAGSIHSSSSSSTRAHGEPAKLPAAPHFPEPHSIVSVGRDSSRSISRSMLERRSREDQDDRGEREALEAAPRVVTEPGSVITPPGRPQRMPRPGTPRPDQRVPAQPAAPQPAAPQPTPVPHAPYAPNSSTSASQPASQSASRPSASRPSQPVSQSASRPSSSKSSSKSKSRSSSRSRSGSNAQAAPQMPPGIGAIDPMAIPTPPEIASPIYSHIRRLALQADLTGADRVLRDALAELTSSLSCSIVYPGQDGLWTLGDDDEIPRDPQPLIAVATARRAVVASHMAMIPVVTSAATVAVITLTRNQRQPAYQPIEQVAMVALAREAAPILHHLAVQHLQRASEIKADKGSLYRGEALEAHRTRGQEGVLVQLSPAWVKRAYPLLIITIVIASIFAVFVNVPTYSTGSAVIMFEGSTSVTSMVGGTVDKVFVKNNEAVKKGDPLLRLNSPDESAQLTAAETTWRDTSIQFLFDQTDAQITKQLAEAANNRDHALARLEARTVRAPRDGVVANLHVKEGVPVQPGGYIMQITDEDSEIEILAFMPSKDLPRIRSDMGVQLELDGYTKGRPIGKITHIQVDAVSGPEAAKLGGEMLAESIAKELGAGKSLSWIAVRARLAERTFKSGVNTYRYHHGMHAKAEIKIQSKPFLATLLPAIEKYLPD
jgi:biotin carboxyl carrier protein